MINTKDDRIFALCFIGFIICDIILSYYVVHDMLSVWHKSQSIMFYPSMLLASIREMSNSYLPEDLSKLLTSDKKIQLKLHNINIHKFVKLLVLKYFINYVIFTEASYYKYTQYCHYIPLIGMPILKTLSDKDLYS